MAVVAEHVHDRHRAHRRHPFDDAVVVHAGGDQRVIPGHDPHDVLDRLASVERDLLTSRVHGMASELHDGHLHALARPVRRLLEDQRDTLTVERTAE